MISIITDFHSPSVEELDEEKKLLTKFLERETPSLDQGLAELRQKFTEEEERRRDIESKAAGILSVSGLLLALLQLFHQEFRGGAVLILLAFFLLLSIFLSLVNLVPMGYITPRLSLILEYTFEENNEYTKQLYIQYHMAIFNNQEVNNSRLRVLRWSYYPIVFVALLLGVELVFAPLVEIVRNFHIF